MNYSAIEKKHNTELTIWQIANIEYMKYTFIDKDNLNDESDNGAENKIDLFDYIDSVG